MPRSHADVQQPLELEEPGAAPAAAAPGPLTGGMSPAARSGDHRRAARPYARGARADGRLGAGARGSHARGGTPERDALFGFVRELFGHPYDTT